jgi:phage shock protein A
MNKSTLFAAVALLAFNAQLTLAQQPSTSPPASAAQAPAAGPTTADWDKQYAQMQQQIEQMNQQMRKIQETKDPQERQRLMQEHWNRMQSTMRSMHRMWGRADTGGHMGSMMGRHMMWGDYRNLTPEQLRQRQYMMDQWMPMQQMMMDHMMQHHSWMMQQPPETPKK